MSILVPSRRPSIYQVHSNQYRGGQPHEPMPVDLLGRRGLRDILSEIGRIFVPPLGLLIPQPFLLRFLPVGALVLTHDFRPSSNTHLFGERAMIFLDTSAQVLHSGSTLSKE
ncbi:hypothetical protein CVN56_26095 [Rhodococcus sp. AQ5-07]|nr:hypothetical protein CVN56_26095 [Rhodococcus sp. AQ5-07]